ncbi:hypothetical protein CDCA_CDCA01G0066 [Cyanidium caldarium]|uniref:GDT1 family protein n=1 Tax=Cyanidium caldarium TaxID=2771 RepID=A0AAV9IPM8_CYACA|nr:hypothetical protein CDCA_CDCA01G0066 [Cyanidium caldarium]
MSGEAGFVSVTPVSRTVHHRQWRARRRGGGESTGGIGSRGIRWGASRAGVNTEERRGRWTGSGLGRPAGAWRVCLRAGDIPQGERRRGGHRTAWRLLSWAPLTATLYRCLPAAAAAAQSASVVATSAATANSALHAFANGYTASLALVFFSEIGDKTFFIAALLAMKYSRIAVLFGTAGALAIMTVISVVFGQVFHALPPLITSNIPFDDWAACALLVFFGVSNIRQALRTSSSPRPSATTETVEEKEEEKEAVNGTRSRLRDRAEEDSEEREAAAFIREQSARANWWRRSTDSAESATFKPHTNGALGSLTNAGVMLASLTMPFATRAQWAVAAEAFTLVFLAEWGDRSMLATIALAAAKNPFGVAAGAITGHLLATVLAVLGGSILKRYVSERVVGLLSGTLFLGFALLTLFGMF